MLWGWEGHNRAVLYIALIVVFGFAFLLPVGIAVFRGDGSRGRWDSILVGMFTGTASVGLITGCIALVLIFAPEILASGVAWLAAFSGVIAIPVAMIRATRGWLR